MAHSVFALFDLEAPEYRAGSLKFARFGFSAISTNLLKPLEIIHAQQQNLRIWAKR